MKLKWEIFLCPPRADGRGAHLSFCFTSCLPFFRGFLSERDEPRVRPLPPTPSPGGKGVLSSGNAVPKPKTDAIPMPYPPLGKGVRGRGIAGKGPTPPISALPDFRRETLFLGRGMRCCAGRNRTEETPARRAGRNSGVDRSNIGYKKRIVKKIMRRIRKKFQPTASAPRFRRDSGRIGQALRHAQDRPFDTLRTGPSTRSGQALRHAQDRPFDTLRTGPSTRSGQALRHAQDRPFDTLRTGSGPSSCRRRGRRSARSGDG